MATKQALFSNVLLQYFPRFLRILPLTSELKRTACVFVETAWVAAAYYLLLYMVASHGLEVGKGKLHGSVGGIVGAPIDKVLTVVFQRKRLTEWMPMVEECIDVAGEEGMPGYVQLVSGFMFSQQDGDRSWIKERLASMDSSSLCYAYRMEASNVGLDGSVNSLKLVDYEDNSTLVDWSFELNPLEGACEDSLIDYLGYLLINLALIELRMPLEQLHPNEIEKHA